MHASPDTGRDAISVLLLDDHRVFTDALRGSIDRQQDMQCAAVAHSMHEALARAAADAFDVAIVDLDLPDSTGLEAIVALRALRPVARIIVLTAHARTDLVERALAAGAVGFVGKDATLDRILDAVRNARTDRAVVDIGPGDTSDPVQLTHREHDVLRHLARGHDANRIAAQLGISLHTSRSHIKAVLAKLGARSQLAAVVTAERLGLISIGSRF